MKRVYCSPKDIKSDKIYLPPDKTHYIKDVLRLQKGDKLEIFDGKGARYNCSIIEFSKNDTVVKIESSEFSLSKESAYRVTLAQALPNKPAKMDFIIEKATELGVDNIIPVAAERSIVNVGVNGRSPLHKLQRWQKIASEASRQCGRSKIPQIKDVLSVEKALAAFSKNDLKLFACINKDTIKLHDALKNMRCRGEQCSPPTIAIFIGPEGDFTKDEIMAAKENGFTLVFLGERVLRTETAGLYVLSILDYQYGYI